MRIEKDLSEFADKVEACALAGIAGEETVALTNVLLNSIKGKGAGVAVLAIYNVITNILGRER